MTTGSTIGACGLAPSSIALLCSLLCYTPGLLMTTPNSGPVDDCALGSLPVPVSRFPRFGTVILPLIGPLWSKQAYDTGLDWSQRPPAPSWPIPSPTDSVQTTTSDHPRPPSQPSPRRSHPHLTLPAARLPARPPACIPLRDTRPASTPTGLPRSLVQTHLIPSPPTRTPQ